MEIEVFKKAKLLREKIDHMHVKRIQLEKMKSRENDDDFNVARELAHDAIFYAIGRLEEDFKSL